MAAAAFISGVSVYFLGPPMPFLNAANQFVLLALNELLFIIRQPRKFLFQPASGNVPVSFDGQDAHKNFLFGYVPLPRHLTRHNFPRTWRADAREGQ